MEQEKKMITLKSSDGVTFEVDKAVLLQSQSLTNVVEDCDDPVHKIHGVTGKILAKVVEYCESHHVAVVVNSADSSSSSSSGADDGALKKWDAEFITKMDLSTVYDLITAARYLNIEALFDLACQRVADVITACKDEKEIRATLGIVSDYTAEEEAEVLKENEWAFD